VSDTKKRLIRGVSMLHRWCMCVANAIAIIDCCYAIFLKLLVINYVTKYVTMRLVKLLILSVFMLCLTLLIC